MLWNTLSKYTKTHTKYTAQIIISISRINQTDTIERRQSEQMHECFAARSDIALRLHPSERGSDE